ncbi:MAG: transposase [Pseudanabaena sp.]
MRQPYNTDLSNEEWEIIAPMLPKPSKLGRPPKTYFREVVNGIFYIALIRKMLKNLTAVNS